MNRLAIVYWSGTGNTEAMAEGIAEGAREAGAEVELMGPGEFSAARFSEFGAVAFGCPAMGGEVLEEGEFDPFFTSIEGGLSGKEVALFGSYGWGDGQWMRDWQDRVVAAGAVLYRGEGLIVNETPDASALENCSAFGAGLASF